MPPSRAELRQATQERVLTAADSLFRERGFDATTIRDIAEASGVSVGSVMASGDKNALLVRVFDSLIEKGHAQPPTVVGRGDSCADGILNLVRPFVALFTSRQDLSRMYASIQASGKEPSPLFTRLAALLVEEIGATISAHGCTDPAAIAGTAQAIYFAYIGTLFSRSAQQTIDESELLASLRDTFTSICACASGAHTSQEFAP
ncbi:TetR/AcrR family transcriptional regulator [Agreia pratensis]|uniref:Transcriptional regulator, TetR family n=1 Tax=Agreia pratensis TaxID=150121 RepID=A0A1X7KTL8_9MICO|nr:TetR/AcrR family transcriptional regulator [Agreia pratensis]SMG44745.1 transcriptional regulator, TetR family [Agreia pratensis]